MKGTILKTLIRSTLHERMYHSPNLTVKRILLGKMKLKTIKPSQPLMFLRVMGTQMKRSPTP